MRTRRNFFALAFAALALILMVAVTPAIAKNWTVGAGGRFPTIQAAINNPLVQDGDGLRVLAGEHSGATITKSLNIVGADGATIIGGANSPVVSGLIAGFVFPGNGVGSGSAIRGFTFDGVTVDFAIYSYGADDVLVRTNKMVRTMQAITNWNGSDWTIVDNDIRNLRGTAQGGGIGILIGSRSLMRNTASFNTVTNNYIHGRLVTPEGATGYVGAGLALTAMGPDIPGRVIRNDISGNRIPGAGANATLFSNREKAIPIYAILLNEIFGDTAPQCKIRNNKVILNNLTNAAVPLAELPVGIADGVPDVCVGNTVNNNILPPAGVVVESFSALEGGASLKPF